MDANSYAARVQPAAKSLDLVVGAAVWIGHGQPPAEPPPPRASSSMKPDGEPDSAIQAS